jgi:hypothetical protein
MLAELPFFLPRIKDHGSIVSRRAINYVPVLLNFLECSLCLRIESCGVNAVGIVHAEAFKNSPTVVSLLHNSGKSPKPAAEESLPFFAPFLPSSFSVA